MSPTAIESASPISGESSGATSIAPITTAELFWARPMVAIAADRPVTSYTPCVWLRAAPAVSR